jgi:hypothetical protein
MSESGLKHVFMLRRAGAIPARKLRLARRSAWRLKPGRTSTYRSGKTVQTTGATSLHTEGIFLLNVARIEYLFDWGAVAVMR